MRYTVDQRDNNRVIHRTAHSLKQERRRVIPTQPYNAPPVGVTSNSSAWGADQGRPAELLTSQQPDNPGVFFRIWVSRYLVAEWHLDRSTSAGSLSVLALHVATGSGIGQAV